MELTRAGHNHSNRSRTIAAGWLERQAKQAKGLREIVAIVAGSPRMTIARLANTR